MNNYQDLFQVRFQCPDGTELWLGRPGTGSADDPDKSPAMSLSEAQEAADERNRVHGPAGYKYWLVPAIR